MVATIEHLKNITKIKKKIIIHQSIKDLEDSDFKCEVCGGETKLHNSTFPGMELYECNECKTFMTFLNKERVINDDRHFM